MFPIALVLSFAGFAQELAPGDVDARLDPALRQTLEQLQPGPDGWGSEAIASETSRLLKELALSLASGEVPACVAAPCVVGELVPTQEGWASVGAFRTPGLVAARAVAGDDAEHGDPEVRGPEAWRRAAGLFRERWGAPERVELHQFGVEESTETDGVLHTAHTFEAVRVGTDGSVHQLGAVWHASWRAGQDGLQLVELRAEEFERADAPGPLLVEVTPPGLLPSGDAALGIDELRMRYDHRLGLPLLAAPLGVAVGDVNGDGRDDVYLCAPGGVSNRLLLGAPGGAFVDATEGSGADLLDLSRAALLLDLDRDGNTDLVVGVGGALLVLRGDGDGHFEQVLALDVEEATSLSAADVDLDGDLDLYACSYVSPYDEEGFPMPYHDAENGAPNHLFENRGEPGGPILLVDATAARGLDQNNTRFSFAAAFEDVDLDGDSDLYVANDFGRNNLYRNDGGHFTDVAAEAGVEDVSAGMGVSFGDVDGDGLPDLLVSNMQSNAGSRVTYQRRFRAGEDASVRELYRRHARGNSLFRNLGDGTFLDASEQAGVTRARWAWGGRLLDVDGDGRLDALTPNGFLTSGSRPDL